MPSPTVRLWQAARHDCKAPYELGMSSAQQASYTKKELAFFFFFFLTGPVTRLIVFCFIFMSLQTCIFSFVDREMLIACLQMHGYCF